MSSSELVSRNAVATPVAGSILVLEEILLFDPYLCDTAEEAVSKYANMLTALNRGSLYYAWSIGRFVEDIDRLKRQFGITSLKGVADMFGVSTTTLYKYRGIKRLLTANEMVSLANRATPVAAMLEVGKAMETHPEHGRAIMDRILNGEALTASDVSNELARLVTSKQLPHNLFPGGESPEGDADSVELQRLLTDSDTDDDTTPAEAIIAADCEATFANSDMDDTACDADEDDEDYADASDSDCGDSLNKKDIKVILRNIRNTVAPLRRAFNMLSTELREQLDAVFNQEDVVLGDSAKYDEYTALMKELYQCMQTATETLAMEIDRGQSRGYIKRPCVLPESADITKLFRNENG